MKYRDDGEVNGIKDRRMDGQGGKGKAAVRKEKMGGLRIYIQKQIPWKKATTAERKQCIWGGLGEDWEDCDPPQVVLTNHKKKKQLCFESCGSRGSKCREPLIHLSGGLRCWCWWHPGNRHWIPARLLGADAGALENEGSLSGISADVFVLLMLRWRTQMIHNVLEVN